MDIKTIEKSASETLLNKPFELGITTIGYFKKGFKEGAEWRINSVWHDADEEPERSGCILIDQEELEHINLLVFLKCDDSDRNYHANSVLSQRYPVALIVQQGVATWGEIRGLYRFKRWAYVADLLPELEEEGGRP